MEKNWKACVFLLQFILSKSSVYLFSLSPIQGEIIVYLVSLFLKPQWFAKQLEDTLSTCVELKKNLLISAGILLLLPLSFNTIIFKVYLLFSGFFVLCFWNKIWHNWRTQHHPLFLFDSTLPSPAAYLIILWKNVPLFCSVIP